MSLFPLQWEPETNREWRARFIVSAYAVLPKTFRMWGVDYTSRDLTTDQDGKKQTLVESRYLSVDITTAVLQAREIADELADRIGFLSFAGTDVSILSVTYPNVAQGATFEIAIPGGRAFRSAVDIQPGEIAQLDQPRSEQAVRGLRHLRAAVSCESDYQAFAQLWAAVEDVAHRHAKEAGDVYVRTCKKCGDKTDGDPRTDRYIEQFFAKSLKQNGKDGEAPSLVDKGKKIRNKIVHGGKLQAEILQLEIQEVFGTLLSGATIALSEETRAKASVRLTSWCGAKMLIAQMVAQPHMATEENVTSINDIHFGRWLIHARGAFIGLPDGYGREQPVKLAAVDLPFPFLVPNLCWPAIGKAGAPSPASPASSEKDSMSAGTGR